MIFLGLVSNWLSEAADGIMGAIEKGVRTLSFSLATIVYKLIIDLYNLFETLCTARLLSNELLSELSKRIGLILGLIMVFSCAFSFIKMLIDPDSIEDKEKGAVAIVKRMLIVLVLLGVSNFAFNTLYKVQKIVVSSHIVSNLLLPYKINDEGLNNFGAILSEELMFSFYQLEDFSEESVKSSGNTSVGLCRSMVTAFGNQIINQHRFDLGYNCLNESVVVDIDTNSEAGVKTQEVFIVNYNWVLCVVAGIFVVYLLFLYCIKVGVRMIQLMVLEIISPMAIVSYLSPKKDNMFSKWLKIYFSTYIDVFIRIAIINFVVFLIATVLAGDIGDGFWSSIGNPTDTSTVIFLRVVIILALLTFAKKAPDLIKELFPSSGASKLGFGASMKDIVGLNAGLGMVAGAGTAAAVGLIGGIAGGKGLSRFSGALGGAIGGALRGGKDGIGAKGIGKAVKTARTNQASYNLRRAEAIAGGSTFFGRSISTFQKSLGIETAGDVDARDLASLNDYIKLQDTIEGYAENNSTVKEMKRAYEALVQAGKNENESDSEYTARLERARTSYKNSMKAVVNASMNNEHRTTFSQYDEENAQWIDVDIVVDKEVAPGVYDTYTSDSIRSGQAQINREKSNNEALFGQYNTVTDYTTMDDNTNRARRDSAQLTSTSQYAKNKANNKFSTKK